ncbi:MAG: D-alanyl-D-alanine carboxypeptidase, partial [Rhodobiaceae bacterium]|nr:D-alanyl-D-alanine carboxypeptidase [Rhodobiaceae bacterium]
AFEHLADQVAADGITHVDGAVVGDATYFSGPDLGPEWNPRDLNEWFAAAAPSLSFNENMVTLQILPAAQSANGQRHRRDDAFHPEALPSLRVASPDCPNPCVHVHGDGQRNDYCRLAPEGV